MQERNQFTPILMASLYCLKLLDGLNDGKFKKFKTWWNAQKLVISCLEKLVGALVGTRCEFHDTIKLMGKAATIKLLESLRFWVEISSWHIPYSQYSNYWCKQLGAFLTSLQKFSTCRQWFCVSSGVDIPPSSWQAFFPDENRFEERRKALFLGSSPEKFL